jgi:hypothetical protein
MKNTSLRIKILSGMLCTGLVLSGTNLSFAAVNPNGGLNEKVATNMSFKFPMGNKKVEEARLTEMKAILEAVIKDSVKSKIITQTEGDRVLEYANLKADKKCADHKEDKKCKKEKCGEAKGGLFNDLVIAGILTQEKSDALRQRMYVKKTEIRTAELQKGLKTLVANKVLTMEQSNKVQEAILARDAERKENYKIMKNMSKKERKAYMKKIKSNKVNPMKVLIDKGIITKEQEKEIQKILPHYAHGHHGHK